MYVLFVFCDLVENMKNFNYLALNKNESRRLFNFYCSGKIFQLSSSSENF